MRHDPELDFAVEGPERIAKLADVLQGGFSDIAYEIIQTVA